MYFKKYYNFIILIINDFAFKKDDIFAHVKIAK